MRHSKYSFKHYTHYKDLRGYEIVITMLDMSQDIPPRALQKLGKFAYLHDLVLNTDLIERDIEAVDLPALESLTLVGRQGYFPAWIANLPKLKNISFNHYWTSALPAELASLPHLQTLYLVLQPSLKAEKVLPTLHLRELSIESLVFDAPLMQAIAQCTTLEGLYLSENFRVEKNAMFVTLPAEWANLVNLQTFEIVTKITPINLPTEWCAPTQWKEMVIETPLLKNFPFKAESLQNLTTLDISGAKKIALNDVLNVCNPEKLTCLHWVRADLKELPSEIGRFTALKDLNLAYNSFNALPADILKLENLQKISFTSSPFSKLTRMRYQEDWKDFMRNMRRLNWDFETQSLALALLQKQADQIKQATITQWKRIFEHEVTPQGLALNVSENFSKYGKMPLPSAEELRKAVFYLVGKPAMYYTPAEFKKRMKKRGLTLNDTFDDTITHIIVGKLPVGVQNNLQQVQGAFSFEQISEWLNQFETASFEEVPLETEETDNLRLLLTSDDAKNVAIALQIMLHGGIPEALYPAFFWLAFALPSELKTNYNKVYKAHLPTVWQFAIDKYRRKLPKTILQDLLKQTDLPAEDLLLTLLRDFSIQLPDKKMVYFALRTGGKPAIWLIKQALNQDVLDFQNYYLDLSYIPAEIAQFPEIAHLKLWSSKPLYKGLKHLTNLPNLQKISILQKNSLDIVSKINELLPNVLVL